MRHIDAGYSGDHDTTEQPLYSQDYVDWRGGQKPYTFPNAEPPTPELMYSRVTNAACIAGLTLGVGGAWFSTAQILCGCFVVLFGVAFIGNNARPHASVIDELLRR